MRRALGLVCLAALSLALLPSRAFACSCAAINDRKATETSPVVFAGTLTTVRTPFLATGDKTLTYLFEVDTVVKGEVHERAIMKNRLDVGNSCNDELEEGERYLVFGEDPESLEQHLCSPTRMIGALAVDGEPPLPGRPTLPLDLSWAKWTILLLACGGGYLLWRRFRDPLSY